MTVYVGVLNFQAVPTSQLLGSPVQVKVLPPGGDETVSTLFVTMAVLLSVKDMRLLAARYVIGLDSPSTLSVKLSLVTQLPWRMYSSQVLKSRLNFLAICVI